MAELNLNFHQQKGRREPTKQEIYQIERLALNIKAIIKALYVYTDDSCKNALEKSEVCMGICDTVELLIEPIIEYMMDYAGSLPAQEEQEA